MCYKPLIVLPAFNVENVIEKVISLLPKDTCLVDDGSTDNTSYIVKKLGYSIIQHSTNLGLSSAIKTGELYGIEQGYSHILLIDADGQHPPEFYSIFLSKLKTENFVLGDRFSNLDDIPPQKIASNLFASLLIKKVTGIFIRDVSCGYRGYKLGNQISDNIFGGYTQIYHQIIEFAIAGVTPERVFIPAIYDIEQPLVTKHSELIALCLSLLKFSNNYSDFPFIYDSVIKKNSFKIKICDVPFEANYIEPYDSYLFSTDLSIARSLYGN